MEIVATHKGTDFDALASVVVDTNRWSRLGGLNQLEDKKDLERKADQKILTAFVSPAYSQKQKALLIRRSEARAHGG
jgi:hypothetical protein